MATAGSWWIGALFSLGAVVSASTCAMGVNPVQPGTGGAGGSSFVSTSSSATSGGLGGTVGTSTTGIGGAGGSSAFTSSTTVASSATSSTAASSTAATTTSSSSGAPVMGLSVEYLCDTTDAMSQEVRPYLKIANGGTASVSLTGVTMRYYFTADGSTSQAFVCDYAQLGCSLISGAFFPTTGTNADTYLEISFADGAVNPGDDSGEIQARFHDTNYAVTFTQTNDYSFDATKTAYANWAQITLYQNGTLVWGTEP
jgi:Cellulose binding domain